MNMTNEMQSLAPQIASSLFDLLWPIVLKYGISIGGVFISLWWIKKAFTLKAHTKKTLLPLLAIMFGIASRFGVVAGEHSIGAGGVLSTWNISLEVFRGIGIGITASLFQMVYGWKVEQWLNSKFPKKD